MIAGLTLSANASCSYMHTALKFQCEANELKKKEIKAIQNQTKVLEKILNELKKVRK